MKNNYKLFLVLLVSLFAVQGALMAKPPLVAKNPSPEVVNLYNFLQENYERKIISGTMANVAWNTNEADWVYKHTGTYPALTGFDFMHKDQGIDYTDTKVVENWWKNNGIVTMCWHWYVPLTEGSSQSAFYTAVGNKEVYTTFDISKAVVEGTYENKIVKKDMEEVANYLLLLKNKNIPVLWRPFHEAAGTWFWWGAKGPEPCKALWKMMFELFEAKGLNNLIWVWTAEPKDIVDGVNAWYPGDDYVDMIGRDIYNKTQADDLLTEYNNLKMLYPGKIITLSEFGNVAGVTDYWNKGAKWSWMMPWYDYQRTLNPLDGNYDSNDHKYAPVSYWKSAFANPDVITRDQMPSLKHQAGGASFVGTHGQLAVKGLQLVDKNGEPLVLSGVSFGWHNWWPKFYDKETVAWLKTDWNTRVVRAAIGVEPNNAYIENPALALKCATTVIDAAIANDLYVIVDWHSHHILLKEAKVFFTQIAGKYKGYPHIIYEIFNEPWDDDMSWKEVKEYAVEMIKTIRNIDPDNIILVGNPHWDQDVHVAADDPITGYDNIMYTLHFYAATHKQELRDRADYALSKGLPIFVSECAGMEASGDGAINKEEWNAWKQWMAARQISWVAWSVSSKTETCSMIAADDRSGTKPAPVSHWKDEDLKEWGRLVKNELINK